MQDTKTKILYNKQVSKHYFQLGLKTDWHKFNPGQFVMVRIPDNVVFLRRPFSISRSIDDGTELLYKVVGPGTERLSRLEALDKIDVLGPLGNGFKLPTPNPQTCPEPFDFAQDKLRRRAPKQRVILVAGGFGIAPFLGLIEILRKKRIETTLYYGGKGLEDILFLDEFEEKGVKYHISTEDGTLGHKGMITELLFPPEADQPLAEKDIDKTIIYSCGPKGLSDVVIKLARKHKIPAQISYESYMGCGIGVCLGCAVKTKEGYKRACKDGPVFSNFT